MEASAKQQIVRAMLAAFAQHDMNAAVGAFSDNATFKDALFPQTELTGRDSILKGFRQVAGLLTQSDFDVLRLIESEHEIWTEVATGHHYKGGFLAKYTQVFVVTFDADNRITDVVAYHSAGAKTLLSALASPLQNLLSRSG